MTSPRPRTNPQRMTGQAGFSLLELMVVLVLIAIMTALIIPEMRGTLEGELLRSTARQLARAFHLAASQSVILNQPHRVRLDRTGQRYAVERMTRNEMNGAGFAPLRDLPGSEGKLDPRITIDIQKGSAEPGAEPDGLQVQPPAKSTRLAEAPDEISFYADGTAEACRIILRDRAGFGVVLRVNPATARVQILELEPMPPQAPEL